MNKRIRTALAAAVVAALTLGAVGCSGEKHASGGGPGGANPALANVGKAVGGTPVKGGTLTVLSNQDFTHLDPARNWVMNDMDFGTRLLYRTLVTYKAAPGTGGSELVPDLATDLGTSSNGARTWTFHLKQGITYEDGPRSPRRTSSTTWSAPSRPTCPAVPTTRRATSPAPRATRAPSRASASTRF